MAAPKGNKYAEGNSGKPKKFTSPSDMQHAIDDYFQSCDNKTRKVYVKSQQEIQEIVDPIPYSIEGLCNVLDITRQTLLNYENEFGYEEFFDIVKKAKSKVLQNLVERGLYGDAPTAFSIFLMKNNYGYTDKTEQEIMGKGGTPFNSSPNIILNNLIPGSKFASSEKEILDNINDE